MHCHARILFLERYVRTLTYAILAYVNKNRIRAWQCIAFVFRTIDVEWNSVRRQLREQNKLKQLASAASMRWSEYQLYIDVNKPVYELLRVVDSALPVIGKIYHMFEIQEKIKNLPHHQCAASRAVSVVRQQVGHAAHRSSLRRPGIR